MDKGSHDKPSEAQSVVFIRAEVAKAVRNAERIVVVTGAGASTAAGIPDFRSPDGIYHSRGLMGTTLMGRDAFHVNVFNNPDHASGFYKLMHLVHQQVAAAELPAQGVHQYLAKLHRQERLLKCFTQNIDALEAKVGLQIADLASTKHDNQEAINQKVVVQLHGSIERVRCSICSYRNSWAPEYIEAFQEGRTPPCPTCVHKNDDRLKQGKRAVAVGGLRPDVVLYGENHPYGEEIIRHTDQVLKQDPDLVLVLGTTARISSLQAAIRTIGVKVRKQGGKSIMVNNVEPSVSIRKALGLDYYIRSTCEEWLESLEMPLLKPDLGSAPVSSRWTQTVDASAKFAGMLRRINARRALVRLSSIRDPLELEHARRGNDSLSQKPDQPRLLSDGSLEEHVVKGGIKRKRTSDADIGEPAQQDATAEGDDVIRANTLQTTPGTTDEPKTPGVGGKGTREDGIEVDDEPHDATEEESDDGGDYKGKDGSESDTQKDEDGSEGDDGDDESEEVDEG